MGRGGMGGKGKEKEGARGAFRQIKIYDYTPADHTGKRAKHHTIS